MNKNAKAYNTIKTESSSNFFKPVNLKTILKLEGKRDHSFYEIQNNSIFEIQKIKFDESENKLIKSNWTFDLDKVHQEQTQYQNVYLNEVIESNFFTNIKKQTEKSTKIIKFTKIFLSKFSDSFSAKGACLSSAFLRFILADVINNQNFFLTEADLDSDISVITTVSFCEVFENKILDNFDFRGSNSNNNNTNNNNSNKSKSNSNSNTNNFNNIRIFDCEDEVVIDGIKEVQITKVEQFDKLIDLYLEKLSNNANNSLRSSKSSLKYKEQHKLDNFENISHELFTVKIYKKLNCPEGKLKFKAKLNFVQFRGFAILNNKPEGKNFVNFPKENFTFFNSINTGNFRIFKLSRCIKDTLESNNNFLYVSLPSKLEYIILVHDVLNNIKKRRTSVLSQIIERDIDENLIENYSYVSKSPNKYSTLDASRSKTSLSNFSAANNLMKSSSNFSEIICNLNNDKLTAYENKENDINLNNFRSSCNKSYHDYSQKFCKTVENSLSANLYNIENTNSFSSSNVSFNSLKKDQKSNLSNTNDCLSDIEIDEDEGFVVTKLNLDRLSKIEKNNLSIVFDNFDSILGLD